MILNGNSINHIITEISNEIRISSPIRIKNPDKKVQVIAIKVAISTMVNTIKKIDVNIFTPPMFSCLSILLDVLLRDEKNTIIGYNIKKEGDYYDFK